LPSPPLSPILHGDLIRARETPLDGYKGGWIEIITGGMFSGKSEELIRRLRRAVIARQRVQVFKPLIDDRFSHEEVVSRDDRRLKALPVASSEELRAKVEIGVQIVGIDEIQFFDDGIVQVCMQLADAGIRVVAAGLDQPDLSKLSFLKKTTLGPCTLEFCEKTKDREAPSVGSILVGFPADSEAFSTD
jgi:thymidine kinase